MSIKEDGDSVHFEVYPPQVISYPTHYAEILFNNYDIVVGDGRNYQAVNQKRYILTRNMLIEAICDNPDLRREIGARIDIDHFVFDSFNGEKAVATLRLCNPVGTCELYDFQIEIDLRNGKIALYEVEREYTMGG